MQNTLWGLIAATDIISKLILLVLLCMSIVCWAVVLYKLVMLKTKMRDLQQAQDALKMTTSFDDLFAKSSTWKDSYAGFLLAQYLTEYKLYALTPDKTRLQLQEKDIPAFEHSIDMIINAAMQEEESYVSVLSTSAAISPMVGLFGTVWGLIHAFMAIAAMGGADIAAVAPGIAEALLTTLAGIIVAVPALVMYNSVSNGLRKFEQQIIVFTEKSLSILKAIQQPIAVQQQQPMAHNQNQTFSL